MSDRELRLRLQVRRHGLPEVNLLWNAPAGPDSTIARLVEKVNEVLPLESDGWGLEDYVVELKGADGTAFECLHFQQVSKVLKDDDQVIIRSLLTDDLRMRRASGRHQITADGRHLVDGIAYGRRWLHAPPNRPPVTLPPRKRAKIQVTDDYDGEEEEQENPLLIEYHSPGLDGGSRRRSSVRFRADFDDADDVAADDEFEPGRMEEDEPSASEAEDESSTDGRVEFGADEEDLAAELQGLHDDLENDATFEPLSPSLLAIEKTRLATKGSKSRLRKRKAVDFDSSSSSSDSDPGSNIQQPVATNSPPFVDEAANTRSDSSSSVSSLSDDSDESDSSKGQPSMASSSDDSSSSEDSSEESSDDESGSDGTVIRHRPVQKAPLVESSDASSSSNSSSSSDDSSSESDSEPEEVSSKPIVPHTNVDWVQLSSQGAADTSLNDSVPVAPGQGMRKTQRRNLRRRLARQGPRDHAQSTENSLADETVPEAAEAQQEQEFLARKQALLAMMDTGTPEKPQQNLKAAPSAKVPVPTPYAPGSFPLTLDESARSTNETAEIETKQSTKTQEPEDSSPSQRRLRLNVNAGRRMLFGALGLRNPKTKADEEKLRGDLMKNVRPLKNPRAEVEEMQVDLSAQSEAPAEDEDPDAWREKINYRAVECCDEGVELSEPPFPFAQRWDPQQQYQPHNKKNGGKRKRNAARQAEDAEASSSPKKQRTADDADNDNSWVLAEDETAFEDTVLAYDDPPSKEGNESQFSDVDDLPALPADLASLPDLLVGGAKPGMVITWKHLLLSARTNWTPEMISVTAIVVRVEDADGKRLRLLLAKRDREQKERNYDEHTGERIYDRFEAPDFDGEEDDVEPDDGYRDVEFSELIEPKIVQEPLSSYRPEDGQVVEPMADSIVQETQYSEVVSEPPTSAQMEPFTDDREPNGQQGEQVEGADIAPIATRISPESASSARSTSLGHEQDLSAKGRETNSPSRQLQEMSKTVADSDEQAEVTVLHETQDSVVVNGQSEGQQPSVSQSESASVPSGRQPDPHVNINLGSESYPPVDEDAHDDISPAATPKAEPVATTPRRIPRDHTPPSEVSLPSLDEIWATAATTRGTKSPSKMPVESALKGRSTIATSEARFQLMDDVDVDESSPALTKKQLFPNSTQPIKPSIGSPLNKKRVTRTSTPKTRSSSTFVIPEGSQIVDLSSDSPSRDGQFGEPHAEDDDHQGPRAVKAGKMARKAGKKNMGKQQQRNESMSTGSQVKTRRQSLPAANAKPVSAKARKAMRRATSAAFDGEI